MHDTQVTQRLELPVAKAIELDFSPHGTYLTTWERPLKRDEGEGRVSWSKNMRVWNASSGQLVGEFEALGGVLDPVPLATITVDVEGLVC